jgi:hypothetical protein
MCVLQADQEQQVAKAVCLVAVREAAFNLLSYGIWVAFSHLNVNYSDLPSVMAKCERVFQALRVACEVAAEPSTDHPQPFSNVPAAQTCPSQRLFGLITSRHSKADSSACMMWGALCQLLALQQGQHKSSGPVARCILVLVSVTALEAAFDILTSEGLLVRLVHFDDTTDTDAAHGQVQILATC